MYAKSPTSLHSASKPAGAADCNMPAAAGTLACTLGVHTLAHFLASILPTALSRLCTADVTAVLASFFMSDSTNNNVHCHRNLVLLQVAAPMVLQANHATTARHATRLLLTEWIMRPSAHTYRSQAYQLTPSWGLRHDLWLRFKQVGHVPHVPTSHECQAARHSVIQILCKHAWACWLASTWLPTTCTHAHIDAGLQLTSRDQWPHPQG